MDEETLPQETDDEGLTESPESETISELFERAMAASEDEVEEPDDTGEVEDVGPEDDDDESTDPGELTDEEDESPESEGDGQDEEADEQETEEQEGDGSPETPPDPRDEELRLLKEQFAESQKQVQDLYQFVLHQQKQQQAPAPKPTAPTSTVNLEIARQALFGGDPEFFEKLDPATRAEVKRLADRYTEAEAKAALDPRTRFDQFRDLVEQEIEKRIAPLRQEQYNRQADQLIKELEERIGDDKPRVAALFHSDPRSQGGWNEQTAALRAAVERVEIERKSQELAERERKLKVVQRQKEASKPPRLGKKKRRAGRPSSDKNQPPPLGENETLADYAERLQKLGR